MRGDLLNLVRTYQARGSVFEIGGMLVLAGRRANLMLAQSGDQYFTSRQVHTHFLRELGTDHFIAALDGAPLRHMRSIMQPAFSREAIAGYLPQMALTTQRTAERWQYGQQVEMVETFRRLVTEQTALVMTHSSVADDFVSVSRFFRTAVSGIFGRIAPKALEDPGYVAARLRVFSLARDMVREHRECQAHVKPDYVDLMLAATDENGQPLDERALLAAALVPYFVGIDTVALTCSFLLHTLLSENDLLQAVTAEVDRAFQPGLPDLATLRQMTTLHRVTMETMRVYPAAPFTIRWIREGFEFEGHRLEAGRPVMIATPVTHFLPELFSDPFRFDPERFADPRNEHRQPGAFVPFSTGPHACIGAGMAEAQIMVTIAALLRLVHLSLDPQLADSQIAVAPSWDGGRYTVRIADVRVPRPIPSSPSAM
jgi:cytochrome P450